MAMNEAISYRSKLDWLDARVVDGSRNFYIAIPLSEKIEYFNLNFKHFKEDFEMEVNKSSTYIIELWLKVPKADETAETGKVIQMGALKSLEAGLFPFFVEKIYRKSEWEIYEEATGTPVNIDKFIRMVENAKEKEKKESFTTPSGLELDLS